MPLLEVSCAQGLMGLSPCSGLTAELRGAARALCEPHMAAAPGLRASLTWFWSLGGMERMVLLSTSPMRNSDTLWGEEHGWTQHSDTGWLPKLLYKLPNIPWLLQGMVTQTPFPTLPNSQRLLAAPGNGCPNSISQTSKLPNTPWSCPNSPSQTPNISWLLQWMAAQTPFPKLLYKLTNIPWLLQGMVAQTPFLKLPNIPWSCPNSHSQTPKHPLAAPGLLPWLPPAHLPYVLLKDTAMVSTAFSNSLLSASLLDS